MKRAINIAVAVLGVGVFGGAAQAGHREDNLVSQAHRIESYADQLKREISRNFRHSHEYAHLMSDAGAIRREAANIDSLAHEVHCASDLRHVVADLRELDHLVHHLGELIGDLDRGRGHGRGHGRSHCDTRRLRSLVADINCSIHSMEESVRGMADGFRRSHSDHRPAHRVQYDRRSIPGLVAGEIFREVIGYR